MVKTNYYNGLNPAVSQALINLQYRYSDETPEMWCSRIRYPFRTLLENNPKYFSKNGFIQMVERVYIDWEFKAERRSFNIYCTVCDTLVFIRENIIEFANHHLNECIAKTAKRHFAHSNPIQKKEEETCHRLVLMRIIEYSGWTYMLKWLSNPEYYHINKFGNESIVKSSEYALYVCKLYGRTYPSDLLKIYYFETKYLNILGEEINIDFSNPNNNCEYVRQIFWSIDSSPNLIAKGLSTGLVKSKTTNSRS
ncbi:19506_t:CDS:2, partial [Gigaspora rosea]